MADPTCFFDDCFYPNGFQWQDGVLTNLGTLPGGRYSSTDWISGNGLIAGWSENGTPDPLSGLPEFRAVLWKGGQIFDLGTLGGYESVAFAVNSRGQVAGFATNTILDPFVSLWYVGLSNATQSRAVLWEQGVMHDLGTLGGPDAAALLINENGQVAGISYPNSTPNPDNGSNCAPNVPTQDPFYWEKETRMMDIGTLGGTCGIPLASNNRGQVVGVSDLAGNRAYHPFFWDKHGHPQLTDLGTFGGTNGFAYYVNDAGEVVGSADFSGDQIHHAFLWRKGVMTDLGTVGSDLCSRVSAINSRGQIVGGSGDCNTFLHAYLWEMGGPMIDLNTLVGSGSRLTLTVAVYINNRGEIAAQGTLPNGDQRAALLIPCDEDNGEDDGCQE
jgi:probable HAF family extracellular repeat protein